MSTFAGLNTTIRGSNPSATPDPTIAVGTLQYCEHVNSEYQCWWKGGANANQPVSFLGNANPKTDSGPWSQNSSNSGNTPNCPTAYSPNAQLIHDNVYNLWILEKRITSHLNMHNYMCVAISNVEDVSSSSPAFGWFAFEYDLDTVIPTNSHGNYYYPDYPQSGLWQSSTSTTPPYTAASDQAMWITYDLQDLNAASDVVAVLLCAVDLAGLRASTSSPYQNNSHTPACVLAHPLTTFDQRRSWVPANNSDTTPPIDADGEMFTYEIEPPKDGKSYLTDPNHTQGVEQWTINWTATTPAPTEVNSWDLPSTLAGGDEFGCFIPSSYYNTVCIPQPSTATTGIRIDSVADRMQQFFHYTSNGRQGSIWTSSRAMQIVPGSGTFTQTEADVRILQRNSSAPNAVYIAGDYPTLDPVDPNAYVFLPSIVRDKVGNLQGILSVSGPGTNEHPGIDSWTFIPGSLTAGTWGYVANPNTDGDAEDTDSLNFRWGDWSSAVLDPSDGCTVWVAGEYLPQNRTTSPYWYTEMAKLPPMTSCAGSPVTISPGSLNFGSVQVGVQSPPQTVTVTNNQTVDLNVSGVSATGDYTQTNTCAQPVAPGGNCTVSVYFTPATTGTLTGTLTITDDASNSPQTVSLTGSGAASSISLSPTSLAFGNQALNTASTSQNITVTNNGVTNLTVSTVTASGGYSDTTTCTGLTLTPGQTCTITVTFSPTVAGSMPGAITVSDTAAGSPHVATLSGSGLLGVTFSANLTFGATNVGSTSNSQTMTLTNNQSTTFNFTYTVSGDFTAVGNGASPCNGTLAAKAKCTFGVTFSPTINGAIKGALAVSPTGGSTIISGGLTGTGQNGGTAPLTFSPTSLSFGNVGLGTVSTSKTVSIKNNGSTSISITSVTGEGFFTVTPSGTTPCGGTLNSGKSCTVTATFDPLVTGSILGAITVIDTASVSTQTVNMQGTGVLDVTLSPATINFGSVAVGSTSSVQVVTVVNNLATAVTINSVVASGDFISTPGGAPQCSASVPANSTCTLGVEFAPSVTGSISGALTFSYGAGSSPQVVGLTGTGTTAKN